MADDGGYVSKIRSVSENERLNRDVYADKECERCGRKYPDTVLNIEGRIHHNGWYVCLDNKSCRRAQRKKK